MRKLRVVEELAKHPFMKRLMDDRKPIHEKFHQELIKRAGDWNWSFKLGIKLEDPEWYRFVVFEKQSALFSVLDRIVFAHAFIQKFPMPRTYEKRFGITQYQWLKYHFLFYIFSVVSLFDCILITTNAVFRIGILDRDCKRDTIIRNYWIRQIGFDEKLRQFEKFKNKYKEIRDRHLHRGKGKELEDIMESDDLAFLNKISFLQLHVHGDKHLPQKIIDSGYQDEVTSILESIEQEAGEIVTSLNKIFSILLKQYLKRRNLS